MKITAADLFCGAGGTSTGLQQACELLGYSVDLLAINHWEVAIQTHSINHPKARHMCASLDSLNPRELFAENELDLLWASPECTHHSVARGGKPINDQSRATAWCVVRWAEALRPKVIMVENVPEFLTWGAIDSKGKPMKSKKGATFLAWVEALKSLGYRIDWKILCAADYGDPTTRKRLFVQAVRGRRKISWPEPTHAKPQAVGLFETLKPWRGAKEIIDWELPSRSIFTRERPLSQKTLDRILAGLQKYGLAPFIVPKDYGEKRVRSVNLPLQTVTTRDHPSLVQPFIIQTDQTGSNGHCSRSMEQPIPAVVTKQNMALVQPYLVQVAHEGGDNRTRSTGEPLPTVCGNRGDWALAEPMLLPQCSGGSVRRVSDPVPAITTTSRGIGLIEPYLIELRGTSKEHIAATAKSLKEPIGVVSTSGHHGLVEPFLVSYYGNGEALSIDDPMDTVTTKDRFGLVQPTVIIDGEKYLLDIHFRMLQPHELAGAQGFPKDYKFAGGKTQAVKQIGNAVPVNLASALCQAVIERAA
jgi:DNA (cytosine-5)-methyltransferase 1